MSKEIFEKRILEIQQAINESAANHKQIQLAFEQATANHNALLGRLNEAQFLLTEVFEKECKDKPPEGLENAAC